MGSCRAGIRWPASQGLLGQAALSSAKPLIDSVVAEFGKLDILINNAAIAIQGHLVDDPALDAGNYNRQWQVNVMGTIANTRAAAPRLSDGGRIIFIGSRLGSVVPFAGVADYAGTKWALAGYAKGIARDLGPRNINCECRTAGHHAHGHGLGRRR